MNRKGILKKNVSISLLHKFVAIISGLILPRLILTNFGIQTHGLVSSIGQFLGIITFLDFGVGSVVKSALYRPLAKKDDEQINSVLTAAKNYFQKIAYILIVYVLILIVFYPLLVDSANGYLSTALLIISMSISHFGRYYFGIVNELLLGSNQKDYIQLSSDIVVIILNLIVSVILIYQGATIEIVKLGSGLVYLFRPLYLNYYVNRFFDIDYDIELKEDPLPQKWSGMGQHIAYSIQIGTDVIVLTLFSTLQNVSVYAVYNMLVSVIKTLLSTVTTGIQSLFGDLYARDEIKSLNLYFDKIEWIVHIGVVYLHAMTAVLITSFVMIYTAGVESTSYDVPLFSFLLVLASALYSLRTPYQAAINAAGHFRQTRLSAFIEAGLNLVISVALVNLIGLVGVALGTLISTIYRTLYLIIYLSRNIVFRSVKIFSKQILVDFISMTSIIGMGMIIKNNYQIETLVDWIIVAVILGIISIFLLAIINLFFYKDIMISTVKSILLGK